MSKGESSYDRFKELSIGMDFKKVSVEGLSFSLEDVKSGKDKPFGPLNSAVVMRVNEAKTVKKNLKTLLGDNRITPEMADHVRALPMNDVFSVNQTLCALIAEHIGDSPNAFTSSEKFDKALAAFGLPPMGADM